VLSKVLGARFLVAAKQPQLFEGVPSVEHPYLQLCGLTCIALLTDIVCDLFKNDLASQLETSGIQVVKQRLFFKLYPLPLTAKDKNLRYERFSLQVNWPAAAKLCYQYIFELVKSIKKRLKIDLFIK